MSGNAQPKHGVLVADDEPGVRNLVRTVLQSAGYQVWTASSGDEAVEQFQGHHQDIQLVLLDVRMPGSDGPATLAKIRSLNPRIACCFMSGHTGEYSTEDLHRLGAVHCFEKPLHISNFLAVIAEACRHGRSSASDE